MKSLQIRSQIIKNHLWNVNLPDTYFSFLEAHIEFSKELHTPTYLFGHLFITILNYELSKHFYFLHKQYE